MYRWDADMPDSIGHVHSYNGNFGVLLRAWTYIRTMGPDGLKAASELAVLNAGRFMAEAGCDAIKLEGGKAMAPRIQAIVDAGIPAPDILKAISAISRIREGGTAARLSAREMVVMLPASPHQARAYHHSSSSRRGIQGAGLAALGISLKVAAIA